MENRVVISQKLKIEYNSAIPLLGMYLKEMKPVSWRDVCIPIIHNTQDKESFVYQQMGGWRKCSFCLSVSIYIHTHTESITMEYYLAIREGNPAVCDSMNGPWEHYVKSDKSEKDKHLWSQMWNLKKLNLLQQSWMVVSRDWDGQGGGSRKIVVKQNKLLGIRWVVLGI